MAHQHLSHQRHTYADYLTWPNEERWELIDGVPYAMGPAPLRIHQEVVGEVLTQIANQLRGKHHPCRVYVAPFDVRLPKGALADEAIDTVVQPDISVVCDESRLDERGCVGAPDWIIEVLSPASSAHDQIRKRDLYERAAVRHYLLVHPRDHILTRYRLTAMGYGKPELQETVGTTEIDLPPLLTIDWTGVFPGTIQGS